MFFLTFGESKSETESQSSLPVVMPVVHEEDRGEDDDGRDEDPGHDEAVRPQRLPRVQADEGAAPPGGREGKSLVY